MAVMLDSETCSENLRRFLERAVAAEEVWWLADKKGDGAVVESNEDEGAPVLMFWSDAAYARRVQQKHYPKHQLVSMPLLDFLFRWLPGMHGDEVLAGPNWTEDLIGLEISAADLQKKLYEAMGAERVKEYKRRVQEQMKQEQR